MQDDIAVRVKNVSKDFLLPHERNNSIKSAFINPFKSAMHKNTSRQHALKNVLFDIKKGEFFGIVGRNGSGKSTLLKMIAGIYQPNKGSIQVSGKLVPFIELGVGFNPELTGRQNVYLNGALLGFSEKEVRAMYNDIVEFAELGEFMDQKLKNYSSGMQVRLAFSMAVRAKADILLIDEVLAVGDADFQRKCFEYFSKLKRNNKTVIFVSHDMEAVRKYCDRAVLIEGGQVQQEGKAEKVAQAYTRQFNGYEEQVYKAENDNRWGDGSIQLIRIHGSVNKETVTITQTIRSERSVEGCIVGIKLKNAAGESLLGTNTKLEHITIGAMRRGDEHTITWKVDNIFSDGKILIDSAIHHLDEITVADWLEDALELSVKKTRKLPYSIDPGFKIVVK